MSTIPKFQTDTANNWQDLETLLNRDYTDYSVKAVLLDPLAPGGPYVVVLERSSPVGPTTP